MHFAIALTTGLTLTLPPLLRIHSDEYVIRDLPRSATRAPRLQKAYCVSVLAHHHVFCGGHFGHQCDFSPQPCPAASRPALVFTD